MTKQQLEEFYVKHLYPYQPVSFETALKNATRSLTKAPKPSKTESKKVQLKKKKTLQKELEFKKLHQERNGLLQRAVEKDSSLEQTTEGSTEEDVVIGEIIDLTKELEEIEEKMGLQSSEQIEDPVEPPLPQRSPSSVQVGELSGRKVTRSVTTLRSWVQVFVT